MLVFPVNTSDDVYGNVTEMYERFVLPHLHGKPPPLRSAGEYALRGATQGARKTAWKLTVDRKDGDRTLTTFYRDNNNQD